MWSYRPGTAFAELPLAEEIRSRYNPLSLAARGRFVNLFPSRRPYMFREELDVIKELEEKIDELWRYL